jgi:hypothetical protein
LQVRVTTMSADFITTEIGTVEPEAAVRFFNNHSWQKELELFDNAIHNHSSEYCDPDMTLTALPSHFIAFIKDEDRFDVEVCLPRYAKLFGIFKRVKFYEFRSISKRKVEELIRIFCMDMLDQKHDLLANEVKSPTA